MQVNVDLRCYEIFFKVLISFIRGYKEELFPVYNRGHY